MVMKRVLLSSYLLSRVSLLLTAAGFSALVVVDHTYFHRIPDMIQASYMIAAVELLDSDTGTSLVDLSPYGDTLTTRYYPPLYLHALAWVFRLFDVSYPSVLWLNLPLGLLALLGVYLAGAHLSGPWRGVLAALLLASYPGFRDACSGVYLDGAMACAAALALGLFYAYRDRGGMGRLGGFTVASAAAWLIRWTFVVVPATLLPAEGVGAAVGPVGERPRRLRRTLILTVASALAVIPFAVWLVTSADLAALLENPGREVTRLSLVQGVMFYPALVLKRGTGGGLGILAGLALLHPRVWRSADLWPLLLGMFGGLAVFVMLPPKHARYVVWLYPYLALITAESIGRLKRTGVRRTLVVVTVVLIGWTVVQDQHGRVVHHANLLPQIVRDMDREWHESRPARVLVHDRYYEPEGDLNAPALMFANAAARGTPKRFVEGLHEDELVYRGRCLARSGRFDFVVLPLERRHAWSLAGDPFFSCLTLRLFKVYDLDRYNGRDAEVRLYKVVSDRLQIERRPTQRFHAPSNGRDAGASPRTPGGIHGHRVFQ